MHLIQQELDQVAHEWNTHTIRSSKHCFVPAGVPNELYFLPEVYTMFDANSSHVSNPIYNVCAGTSNYVCAVSHHDVHVCRDYAEEPDPPASLEFLQAVNELMVHRGLLFPDSIRDAMLLYAELVSVLDDY